MMRVLVVLLVLALFSQAAIGTGSESLAASKSYTPRPPIHIATDDDFTVENGVVDGSGSSDDPYRISGWHIVPPSEGSTPDRTGITIGGKVRHSYFLIENNHIELHGNNSVGVAIGTPLGGTIRDNTIVAGAWVTFAIVVGPGVNDRQDSLRPLQIEGNLFQGERGYYQTGVVFWGTAVSITSNRFVGLDEGVRVAGSLTMGPQTVAIHRNDFVDVDWAVPAALAQTSTMNLPLVDGRENHWGSSEGPTIALCTNNFGCNIAPLGEKGAKVAPIVVAYPYADEPFFPEG